LQAATFQAYLSITESQLDNVGPPTVRKPNPERGLLYVCVIFTLSHEIRLRSKAASQAVVSQTSRSILGYSRKSRARPNISATTDYQSSAGVQGILWKPLKTSKRSTLPRIYLLFAFKNLKSKDLPAARFKYSEVVQIETESPAGDGFVWIDRVRGQSILRAIGFSSRRYRQ
jgi:hypothetical protein